MKPLTHPKSGQKAATVCTNHLVLFRALAILLGLLLIVLLEGLLRLCGVLPLPFSADPFVSFRDHATLFIPNPAGTHYEIARERNDFFRPQFFPVHKSADTFRIFVLGGSTVQGRPYAVETSFTNWLKINLQAAEPDRNFEVINCGGVSYASYRLVPILRETLQYQPDLLILYTGHNEFLEDRSYARVKNTSAAQLKAQRLIMDLRIAAVMKRLMPAPSLNAENQTETTVLPADVNALLDFEKGLESYQRDPIHRQAIMEHFELNLRQMILMARAARVPLMLVNPVSNLKSCPPFKCEFENSLPVEQKARLISLWKQANDCDWSQAERKMQLWEAAADIDQRHAGLLYSIGKTCEHLKRNEEAKTWFVNAKEEDLCPLRILEPMHAALIRSANEFDVPLVDIRELFEQKTPDGIPGSELLVDHVHPSIEGHQLIADAIYEKLLEMKLFQQAEDWQATRNQLRQKQLDSLDQSYFLRGALRSQRLDGWSRGRSTQVPVLSTQSNANENR
ncbi:SGNH/GDSL hydrolase family protein [uncultured Gimesia sp.]|uniref:SGNH/GDSL hydrolase family protein n=1 Tax=uncultured Gimesia sp. TaxID=1678688 RepID=UPI00260FA3A1|nr:SGNH/GDSL hydrolase family protein [uncultured Gimesia sp.]